jgi:hypothetical protein
MMRPAAIVTLLFAVLSARSAVADDDDVQPRFSPSLGIGLIRPLSGRRDISLDTEPAATLDLTLELGSVFVGGSAHLSPDTVFLGARLGYALKNDIVAPYGSVGFGFMSQTAQSPGQDQSVTLQGSGSGFEFEAGVIFLRRRGLGRIWLFGFALLPTFNLRSDERVETPNISVGGFGIRLGL